MSKREAGLGKNETVERGDTVNTDWERGREREGEVNRERVT